MTQSNMRNQHELTKEQKEMRKIIINKLDEEKNVLAEITKFINMNDLFIYLTEALKAYDKSIDRISLIMTDEQERYMNLFKVTKENNIMKITSNPIYSFLNQAEDYNRVIKGETLSSELLGFSAVSDKKGMIKYPLFIFTQLMAIKDSINMLNIIIYNSKFQSKEYERTLEDGFKINELILTLYDKMI